MRFQLFLAESYKLKLVTLMLATVFLISFWSVNCNAATDIIGFISSNTTWTTANSPYVTKGNILVKKGVTLTIEPGVTVKFNPGHSLTVNGTLIAKGTNEQPIKFTAKQDTTPEAWDGIVFNHCSEGAKFDDTGNYISGSTLQYCTVEFAKTAIKVWHTPPFIQHCMINNNKEGIFIYEADIAIIRDSTIADNKGRGIVAQYTKSLRLLRNTVSRNKSQGIHYELGRDGNNVVIRDSTIADNMKGILVDQTKGGKTVKITITGNIFRENKSRGFGHWLARDGGGICIYEGGDTTITNNTFTCNKAESRGGGVFIVGSRTLTIRSNTFTGNEAMNGGGLSCSCGEAIITSNKFTENLGLDGAAIDCDTGKEITNNLIANNIGIKRHKNTSAIYIGRSRPTFTGNTIIDNQTDFDLRYTLGGDFNAANNYWGVTTEAEIRLRIGDFFTGAGRGRVNVVPFLKSAPTNFVTAEEQINLSYSVDQFIPESATGTAFSLPVVKSIEYQAYFPWITSHIDTAWCIILPLTFQVADPGGIPISGAQIFMGQQRLGVTDSKGEFTHNYVIRVVRIPERKNEVIKLPFSAKKNGLSTSIDIPFSWSVVERTSIHVATKEDYERYKKILYQYEFFESRPPLPKELTFLTPFLPLLKMAYDLKKGPQVGDRIDILLVEHRIPGKNPVAWAYYEQIQRGEKIPHYATGWIISPKDKQHVLDTYFLIKKA